MTAYDRLKQQLPRAPKTWLVTGAAGFIGSNLVETLLRLDQRVVGLDNYATGKRENLEEVRGLVTRRQWSRFRFVEGDITDPKAGEQACRRVDYVLHQAALGSVPRSIKDPLTSNASNVTGTLQMLVAARDAKVRRFVFASSSSIYGDHPGLPKIEPRIGQPLSPYAVTKYVNELYAFVFGRCYGLETIGLRYFNVFGPRQDPNGPYAAVIPRWVDALLHGRPVEINGDGKTRRDFCYVANAVQANLLSATATHSRAPHQVYNVALNERTSLNELYTLLRARLVPYRPDLAKARPVHKPFRPGDVRHSLADISKARRLIGYAPTHQIAQGIDEALAWYRSHLG